MKRILFVGTVLEFVPNAILAAVIASFVQASTGTSFGISFILVLACIYAVLLMLWIKDSLWEWFLFVVIRRKTASSQYLDHLKNNKYPEPGFYPFLSTSGKAYLRHVMDNAENPADLRISAAMGWSHLDSIENHCSFQECRRTSIPVGDAILAYKKSFSKKSTI